MAQTSKTFAELITFTRASAAWRINASGLVEQVGSGVARFDHSLAGAALGLLIEEERTNLLLRSNDLSHAAWTRSNMTAALNATGPDGQASSATTLTATAANATALQAITSASAARAVSAWIKRVSGTGAIDMTVDGGSTWNTVTATGSWSRVAIPAQTLANPNAGFRLATNGDQIAVWGVQCENGSFATSTIPTTSASVTRAAESAKIDGANFSAWYGQAQGTVFVSGSVGFAPGAATFPALFTIGDNPEREHAAYVNNGGGDIYTTGVDGYTHGLGAATSGATVGIATAYDATTARSCRDGGSIASSSRTNQVPDILHLGGPPRLNGHIREFRAYKTMLSDAELQALTA